MPEDQSPEITNLLQRASRGDRQASEALVQAVYGSLRNIARSAMRTERAGHTLQPTALVHEAYMKLLGGEPLSWQNRAQFFAVAARQMRRILVDHARAQKAEKRGGEAVRVDFTVAERVAPATVDEVLELDILLDEFEAHDERAARIVELKFFGGLTDDEVADLLQVSKGTVRRDWEYARAWLHSHLKRGE